MDRYKERMNLYGTTRRERTKNRFINHLNDKSKNSLSYKDILLNGKKTQLIINSSTQPYYKDFQSLHGQEINIGDYVEWANSHWLVVTCDSDNEIYKDGKLNQCNYLLKWQNEVGEIIERWAVIQSASKYNDGTDGNSVITLGSDQLSIVVPVDSETIKLKKSMSKKFFIDNNTEDPTVYELTGTGNVISTYNGHGVTSWIVKECAYTASENDLKYGVCDYKHANIISNNEDGNDQSDLFKISISGSKNLRSGFSSTYIADIKDSNGNDVVWDNFYYWNVVSDFDIAKEIDNDKIKLFIEKEELIGSSFILQLVSTYDNLSVAEIEITITSVF